jgi:alkanesulfonate monooxygenase SsuD/methylene tetrahydromethanopterin reductase-like flavin-dependent oxidoreductase (luciferase family)
LARRRRRFEGAIYSTAGFTLAPTPVQRSGPPIWIGKGIATMCATHVRRKKLRAILPTGSAEKFAQKLMAYARAGAQRVFLWPLADERAQLELFRERVAPLLDAEST